MSLSEMISRFSRKKHATLDAEWEKRIEKTGPRLFSVTDRLGRTLHVSDKGRAELVASEAGTSVASHDVFAPDALICKVSGSIEHHNKKDALIAYVDGSHVSRHSARTAAYGIWCYCGEVQAEYAGAICDNALAYRSNGGELVSAVIAIKEAIRYGYEKVVIRYDFAETAIFEEEHAGTPNKSSWTYWIYMQYKAFLDIARERIEIVFEKVPGHKMVLGNEHADMLAHLHASELSHYMHENRVACDLPAEIVIDGHEVLWVPGTSGEKTTRETANQIITNICRGLSQRDGSEERDPYKVLNCSELDRAIVSGKWGERLGLTPSATIYLRHVSCGNWDEAEICKQMRLKRADAKGIRRECGEKLGMNQCPDTRRLFAQTVKIIACDQDVAALKREADARRDLRKASKEKKKSKRNKRNEKAARA